jgi:hypothetical protein
VVKALAARAACAALAAGLLAATAGASPPPSDLPARTRVLLLLRVLLYDRNLAVRAGDALVVAVLYAPGDPRSEADRDEMLAAFDEASQEVLAGGRVVRGVAVAMRSEAALSAELGRGGFAAAYACTGLLQQARAIAGAAAARGVPSAAGGRDEVLAGLAVGVVPRGERAAIVVNAAAARAQGADLEAKLLAVAEVVRPLQAGP